MDLQSTIEIHFNLPWVWVLLVLNIVFGSWASFDVNRDPMNFLPFGFFFIEALVLVVVTIVWIVEKTQ